MPWSPLAMGVLAGRYPLDGSYPADSRAARANWPAIKDRVTLRALETGAVVQVPMFVEVGETRKIDTRDGSYITRV